MRLRNVVSGVLVKDMMKRRKPTKVDREARCYHDIVVALERFYVSAGVDKDDVRRLLACIIGRWFVSTVTVTVATKQDV